MKGLLCHENWKQGKLINIEQVDTYPQVCVSQLIDQLVTFGDLFTRVGMTHPKFQNFTFQSRNKSP